MPRMTGGQALAKSLYREGVRVIFGLPGVQLYHAVDAIAQEPGIRFITTRHEQATAYMADGYARASGEVGTAMVVPGPGLLNASAAIGTAYAASSPTLIVAGQVQRDLIGVNRGILHEVNDQMEAIKQVTKAAYRVSLTRPRFRPRCTRRSVSCAPEGPGPSRSRSRLRRWPRLPTST